MEKFDSQKRVFYYLANVWTRSTIMIHVKLGPLATVHDAQSMLQTAIGVEFGTLPPYLYALYSIPPGKNPQIASMIRSVVLQEMIHMCLASNILNALGGTVVLTPQAYPGPLPGDIGPDGTPLEIHLYPFSKEAMKQGMDIEQPEDPPVFPTEALLGAPAAPKAVTIGQFYDALDKFLKTLPATDWTANRNQIEDNQFFAGQLFAVNGYQDAHIAIQQIVSEGEGAKNDPLDFQDEMAHYYRFGEIHNEKVLTKSDKPPGYTWGPETLTVDWSGVYPAISDPATHVFTSDPAEAQAAQNACDKAYSTMVRELQKALTGQSGALGQAVRAMFDLRMAALHAFTVPLANPSLVAGPAFRFIQTPAE
jgi:hypothetical protein